jgi:type III pantothenate kinase
MKSVRTTTSGFLLIDAGNTRVKWATAGAKGPIRERGSFETKKMTSARIIALARQFPGQQVVLASVVPKLTLIFRKALGARLHVVSGVSPALGLEFDYPKPAELGADRVAGAVAAYAMGHFPAIVVACGTATAFTVLDARGRLCGGVIAPGLQAQLNALLGATGQLPVTELRQPRLALARSTREAIRAGVVLNFQGGVKEIVQQLSRGLPGRRRPVVIATGGNAHYLRKNPGFAVKLRPLLIFEGLLIIGTRLSMPIP